MGIVQVIIEVGTVPGYHRGGYCWFALHRGGYSSGHHRGGYCTEVGTVPGYHRGGYCNRCGYCHRGGSGGVFAKLLSLSCSKSGGGYCFLFMIPGGQIRVSAISIVAVELLTRFLSA